MTTQTFTPDEVADVLDERTPSFQKAELALMRGNLQGLTKGQIADVVAMLADKMGVDPSLAPIDVIPTREGKLVPYINARGAAQLRRMHNLEVIAMELVKERPGLVVLRCTLRRGDGSTDMAIGAAEYREDRPQDEANAWMRAETKAKRRATMSAVGIFLEGPSDEVEGEPA
jgi:hypothetical protein